MRWPPTCARWAARSSPGMRVASLDDLPRHRAVLFDVTPRQLLRIAGDRLPAGYRRSLERYRYGPGVFKLDWALDGPIPWTAQECNRAATVHLGGTLDEIDGLRARRLAGQHRPSGPTCLLVQHSLFDRHPRAGRQGNRVGLLPRAQRLDGRHDRRRSSSQIERFAPGFRERILARSVMPPAAMEQHNANYIGGDINGGVQDIWQLFTRPAARARPLHARRPRASTSARRPRRPAAACTACAATTRRERPAHMSDCAYGAMMRTCWTSLSRAPAGRRLGRPLLHLAQTTSTNDVAADLAQQRRGRGDALVVADEQTRRARAARARLAGAAPAAACSARSSCAPPLRRAHAPRLTMLAAAGRIPRHLCAVGLAAAIKWPNDILINGRKVAGILTETEIVGDRLALCGYRHRRQRQRRGRRAGPASSPQATSLLAESGAAG